MKPPKYALALLLLFSLSACIDLTDPYDRIQGEPSGDNVSTAGMGEGETEENEVMPDAEHEGDAAGEAEAADEGH